MSPDGGPLKIFGVELPSTPRWVSVFIAIAFVIGVGVRWVWTEVYQPTQQLVSLREANAALLEQIQEFNQHLADTPETVVVLRDDVRGKLTSALFKDGCILLAKTGDAKPKSKLIRDLLRDDHPHARLWDWFETPLQAAGRCLANHPGRFSVSYGHKDGCMVPMFRNYEDGCVSSQRVNACNGILEQPFWLKCVH